MPDVHDAAVGFSGGGWEGAVAEHGGEGRGGGHFDERLDFVEGVTVGGLAGSQSVEGERVVGVLGDGDVDVGVIEVVVWEVPVGFVEADTVG